jgi:DNA-binding transcriptional MerR regulator
MSGYRIYPESTVQRVLVVQRALRIGFTLRELAEVLKARDAGGVPCRRVYQMAQAKLEAIRVDLQTLKRMEKYLTAVLTDWKSRIRETAPGQRSHLLYSLTEAVRAAVEPSRRFRRREKT